MPIAQAGGGANGDQAASTKAILRQAQGLSPTRRVNARDNAVLDHRNLLHFGMVVVGLDYGYAGQATLGEITGGSPYGATTIAGGDGSRLPTANELEGARYQGRKIAETANKLHG